MKSPFPGMDPYLERHWRDVHGRLIVSSSTMLNRQIGGDLRARIDERLIIEEFGNEMRSISPDVVVVEHGLAGRRFSAPAGMAIAEPLVIETTDEPVHERFIEIIDPARGGIVVTVIEFLSPTNKLPGDGREQYLRKQQEVISAKVNLVEIDLTRSGRRELALPEAEMPAAARTPYVACIRRGSSRRRFEVYPMPLRNRLPAIRIPLRPTDPDAVIDLQVLVDLAYEEGRHDDIDYSVATMPPLTGEDEAWADQLLREAKRR